MSPFILYNDAMNEECNTTKQILAENLTKTLSLTVSIMSIRQEVFVRDETYEINVM